MKLPSFLADRRRGPPIELHQWEPRPAGLHFSPASATAAHLPAISAILKSPEVGALLDQLVTEDLAATAADDAVVMDWEQVHELVRSPAYASSLPLLELPPALPLVPRLQSRGSLTDPHFEIRISGWATSDGPPIAIQALVGSIVKARDRLGLLPAPVWRLLSALNAFADRPVDQRAPAPTRRHWGIIRRLAVEAGALLDEFLVRSVVVTPRSSTYSSARRALRARR